MFQPFKCTRKLEKKEETKFLIYQERLYKEKGKNKSLYLQEKIIHGRNNILYMQGNIIHGRNKILTVQGNIIQGRNKILTVQGNILQGINKISNPNI